MRGENMSIAYKKIYTDELLTMIGQPISEPFLILQMEESDNTENSWQSFVFGDIRGRVNGKAWSENRNPDYANLVGTVCIVVGYVEKFRGVAEIKVSRILPVEEVNIDEFIRSVNSEHRKKYISTISTAIKEIKNKELRSLVQNVTADVSNEISTFPADTRLHHNIVGGLIQHTAEVVEIVKRIISQYDGFSEMPIDSDMAIAGAILHDMGVCHALHCRGFIFEKDKGFDMAGIGVESNNLVIKNWYKITPDSPKSFDLTRLCHIVMAAQSDGCRPTTKEACLVRKANEISEEMNAFDELFHSYDNSRKTDKMRIKEGVRSEFFGGTMYRNTSEYGGEK